MNELQLQAKCFQKFWNTYPTLRYCLFSVPNGGSRHKAEAMQLKASGLVPGIPDMILIIDATAYGLEFKTQTGIISPEQHKVHKAWNTQNIPVFIIRTEEQFWVTIENILVKHKVKGA